MRKITGRKADRQAGYATRSINHDLRNTYPYVVTDCRSHRTLHFTEVKLSIATVPATMYAKVDVQQKGL
jgi:hypothetical protein